MPRKLTDAQVLRVYQDDRRQREIAAEFGINQSAVSDVKRGHTWRALTEKQAAPPRKYHAPERPCHAVLTPDQVRQIYRDPRPAKEIAKECGVNASTIGSIKRRRTWQSVTADLGEPARSPPRPKPRPFWILR